MPQPDWRDGGAVNAIEKLVAVINGMGALREEWKARRDHVHPLLAPGDIVPTIVNGGTWMVTIPASCAGTADITYLPRHVDAEGTGKAWVEVVAARAPWRKTGSRSTRPSSPGRRVLAEMPADHRWSAACGAGALATAAGRPRTAGTTRPPSRAAVRSTSFGPTVSTRRTPPTSASVGGWSTQRAVALTLRWCGVAS
jgi:acetylornithine deacetylase/succinyl-diaminopimelate desuccinylase-like protein